MNIPPFLRLRLRKRLTGGALARFVAVIALLVVVGVMALALILRTLISPPVEPDIPEGQQRTASERAIQLNILNASGQRGIARAMTDYLRARGFDVVEIGNLDTLSARSYMIDRTGDSASAARVAYALGIADSLTRRDIDSTLYLRCTVVAGSDCRTLKPFR